jgi:hypothetical protein
MERMPDEIAKQVRDQADQMQAWAERFLGWVRELRAEPYDVGYKLHELSVHATELEDERGRLDGIRALLDGSGRDAKPPGD